MSLQNVKNDDDAFLSKVRQLTSYLSNHSEFEVTGARRLLRRRDIYYTYVIKPRNPDALTLNLPGQFPLIYLSHTSYDESEMEDLLVELEAVAEQVADGRRFGLLVAIDNAETLKQIVHRSNVKSNRQFVLVSKQDFHQIAQGGIHQFQLLVRNQLQPSLVSPYIFRGPVPSHMFFGRRKETETLVQQIKVKNSAFTGARRIGKTSLLHHLEERLEDTREFLPVYLNCEGYTRTEEVYAYVRSKARSLGLVVESIDTNVTGFEQLVTLVQERMQRMPIFLLDEVDRLASESPDIFHALRENSDGNKCRSVLVGGKTFYLATKDGDSPLFNFCNDVNILPFLDRDAVHELVLTPMDALGIRMAESDRIVDRLSEVSSGRADVVQYICHELVERIGPQVPINERKIALTNLESVVGSAQFQDHFLYSVWGSATALEKLITLYMMDSSSFEIEQVEITLKKMGVQAKTSDVLDAVDTLCLYNIFARTDGVYSLIPRALPLILRARGGLSMLMRSLAEDWEEQRQKKQ